MTDDRHAYFTNMRAWDTMPHDSRFTNHPERSRSRCVSCISTRRCSHVANVHTLGDADGDGLFETRANGIVSVSCGCSGTPPPLITPPPIPGSTNSSCSGGASFSIESGTFPESEGCFVDTTELRHELPVYTISGTLDIGQFWMVAVEFVGDGLSAVSARMHKGSVVRSRWNVLSNSVTIDRSL